MTIRNLYPDIKPTLSLNFAKVKALDPRITFTRASAATYYDADGVLRFAGNNQARFDHSLGSGESLGLLMEEQRTNRARNPWLVGGTLGIIGAGGVLPTHYSVVGALGGLTIEYIGKVLVNNFPCMRIKISGTATGAASFAIRGETTTSILASPDQTWTHQSFYRIFAGSLAGWTNIRSRIDGRTSTGTVVSGNQFFGANITSQTALTPYTNTGTLTSDAAVARIQPNWQFDASSGAVIDTTLDVALGFMELGAFATSPIFPPENTIAQSTRLADSAVMTGTNFSSWYRPDEGAVYSEMSLLGLGPSNRGMWAIGEGTSISNEFFYYITAAGVPAVARSYLDISQGNSSVSINLLANTAVKHMFAYAVDDVRSCSQGTLGTSITSHVNPVNVSRLTIGARSNGSFRSNSHIRKIAYYDQRITDSQMQALTR